MSKSKTINEAEAVRAAVRDGYGQIAQKDGSCCSGVSCCGSNAEDSTKLAQYVGYSAEELAALPEGANMGLSCGNPDRAGGAEAGRGGAGPGQRAAGSTCSLRRERSGRRAGPSAWT